MEAPSSGRIVQVHARSNSPHLRERAFICLHSLTVTHRFCERQTITSMLQTLHFFYLAGMPWWEYLSHSLALRMHAVAPMNYSKVTLSGLCVISLSLGSPMENALLYSVRERGSILKYTELLYSKLSIRTKASTLYAVANMISVQRFTHAA